jgi:hypothetical protein
MLPQEGPTQADRITGLFVWTFPSVCLLSICNVVFSDAALFAARIVGSRLPALLQRAARAVNSMSNLVLAAIGYLWIHSSCRSAANVCLSNALVEVECAKTVALALCVIFVFSMSDRLSTSVLYPDHTSSFLSRMAESGGVVIAWQLVGEREGLAPLFVALLVARRARFALPKVSKYVCALLRVAVVAIALAALGQNCSTVSQKASVGILLSSALLGSSRPQAGSAAEIPANVEKPIRQRGESPRAGRVGRVLARQFSTLKRLFSYFYEFDKIPSAQMECLEHKA